MAKTPKLPNFVKNQVLEGHDQPDALILIKGVSIAIGSYLIKQGVDWLWCRYKEKDEVEEDTPELVKST